ncbi:MAG: KilA-N domain-containing protein [Polyangiaceae bacterium]|nr:KilA-N domain-containing protein [Polyangiaceae bacterium]
MSLLQKIRDHLHSLGQRRVNWEELARRLAPIFTSIGAAAPVGHQLAKWVNDGVQKKNFPDWFLREYQAWKRRLPTDEQPEPMPKPEAPRNALVQLPLADEPESVTDASLMIFRDTKIRMRGSAGAEQMCLTDMWRANGSDPSKQPSNWAASAQASDLIEFLSENSNPRNSGDWITAERGASGGTWAHWQLAFAYAKYLSPAFHTWVNQAAREKMARGSAPVAPVAAGDLPSWARGLLEGMGQGVMAAKATAEAASTRVEEVAKDVTDTKLAVRQHAAAMEGLVDEVHRLKDVASHRPMPTAPPLPDGWKPASLVADQHGLPSVKAGGHIIRTICDALGTIDDDSMCRVAAWKGRVVFAISPKCEHRLKSAFLAAHKAMQTFGYKLKGRMMVPRGDYPHVRSPAWVAGKMAEAAVQDAAPQLDLVKGGQ